MSDILNFPLNEPWEDPRLVVRQILTTILRMDVTGEETNILTKNLQCLLDILLTPEGGGFSLGKDLEGLIRNIAAVMLKLHQAAMEMAAMNQTLESRLKATEAQIQQMATFMQTQTEQMGSVLAGQNRLLMVLNVLEE